MHLAAVLWHAVPACGCCVDWIYPDEAAQPVCAIVRGQFWYFNAAESIWSHKVSRLISGRSLASGGKPRADQISLASTSARVRSESPLVGITLSSRTRPRGGVAIFSSWQAISKATRAAERVADEENVSGYILCQQLSKVVLSHWHDVMMRR